MFDTTYADKRYYSPPVFWRQQHLLRKHRSLTSVHNIWQNTVYYVLAWYSCYLEKIALQRRKTVPFNYTVSTFLKTSEQYQAKTQYYVLTWFSGWDFLKLLCFGFGRQSGLLGSYIDTDTVMVNEWGIYSINRVTVASLDWLEMRRRRTLVQLCAASRLNSSTQPWHH